VEKLPTVGDSDDVFYDQQRKRIYVSGGEGAIAVYQQKGANQYNEIARLEAVTGARTSLFRAPVGTSFSGRPAGGRERGSHQGLRVTE